MKHSLSRRQFLKASAAGALTSALAPLVGLPLRPVSADAKPKLSVPERVMQAAASPQPFTPLPSTLPLGAPLADISMGADGSVWAIDPNGVPYSYDQVAQTWAVYAPAVDAITYVSRWGGTDFGSKSNVVTVVGSQVITPGSGGMPIPLTAAFANLPQSFSLGLDGLAEVNGKLYLFRHGRYVIADTSTATNAVVGAPVALTSLTNWPTTANWAAGTFQALGSELEDATYTRVHLFKDGEWLLVDLAQGAVVAPGPQPFSEYAAGAILAQMKAGFNALVFIGSRYTINLYQGPVEWVSVNPNGSDATPNYVGLSPFVWPTFAHAPSGRVGALWAPTLNPGGAPAFHDGAGWQVPSSYPHTFNSIDVGADDSVFALADGDGTLLQLQSDGVTGVTWIKLGTAPATAAQLSVGDSNHVWVRDSGNLVYRYASSSFTQVTSIPSATHIAANADGTLWHAAGDGNAYRFISEGTAAATAVSVGGAGTVAKVASTAFARLFALITAANNTPQFYGYDATYVWKTSAIYLPQFDYLGLTQSMVVAGNTMFIVSEDSDTTRFVVALDAQSGLPIWLSPAYIPIYVNENGAPLQAAADINLVYDSALNLLYVGGGLYLMALNASTGQLAWKLDYTAKSGALIDVWGPPALAGNRLCVSDRWNGALVLVDTQASAAQGQAVVLWNVPLPHPANASFVTVGAPVFDPDNQRVYTISQAGDRLVSVTAYNLSDGSQAWNTAVGGPDPAGYSSKLVHDGAIGRSIGEFTNANTAVLFVNSGTAIYAIDLNDGTLVNDYTLPQPPSGPPVLISSGMSYLNNQLFFGDSVGKLYVVNALTMGPVITTTDAPQPGWAGVLGDPALVSTSDPSDSVAVLFARGDSNVWLFDPSSGNLETIRTDQTRIASLVYDAAHGLLYGCSSNGTTDDSLGQVFALQPDQAIQDERDFIIEAQLMQDYGNDTEAAGNGVARYQTHVSVVDSNKTAMPNISVKLWADDDTNATPVNIDGTSYTIGTTQPALFTTDGTGSFIITSDATDLTTTSFRLWAAFMSASERITITPDAEFHQRLATTSATGSTDPNQVDTISATSYDGNTLFSSSETTNAQSAATAITQTTGALGIGASTTTVQQRLSAPPTGKYNAYANLPSMAYTATNVAADRSISAVAPVGLSFTANGYTTHTPGDASDLIDNMTGDETVLLGSVLSELKEAWKEIKAKAAQVKQAAISIAKDLYVGIQYVVDGVTKVVKAVAEDIEDAMVAVGAFFIQLGKDLLKAIEALSVLLHLKKVFVTAGIIRKQIDAVIGTATTTGTLQADITAAMGAFDGFFTGVEDTINTAFDNLISDLTSSPSEVGGRRVTDGSTPLTGLHGMGETATTVYNRGSTSSNSQAVQCGWSSHTLRTNMSQGSDTTTAVGAVGDPIGDLNGLFDTFISNIANNPALSQALDDTQSSFSQTFQATSAKEFFAMAAADLLNLARDMALAGLAVVQSLGDTLMGTDGNAGIVVTAIQNLGTLKIPILSTLWRLLTGNDLTFLDLISFVLAFPVTFMYRAIDGDYPSASATTQVVGAQPTTDTRVMGLVGGLGLVLNGVMSCLLDGLNAATDGTGTPRLAIKISAVIALLANIAQKTFTMVEGNTTGNFLLEIGSILALLVPMFQQFLETQAKRVIVLVTRTLVGVYNSVVAGLAYKDAESLPKKVPVLTLVRQQFAAFPSVTCLSILIPNPYNLIQAAIDLGFLLPAAGIQLDQAIAGWNDDTEPPKIVHRLYFPWVSR